MKKIAILFVGVLISSSVLAGQETRELAPFSKMDIGGAFKIIMKKTGNHKVSIDADDDVIDKIVTEVVGGTLKVYTKGNNIRATRMDLVIEFASVNEMDLSGASSVRCDDVISVENFEIEVSGAGTTKLILETNRLDASMTGAGSLTLSGKAREQVIDITGAGSYNAEEFECDYTEIESSGAGTAKVVANKELKADCSGAGSVRYRGNPDRVFADSNGAGSVKRID